MPCTRPLTGYRRPDGAVSFKAYSAERLTIACGQCEGCRVNRKAEWATRLLHEAQTTEEDGKRSSFITLTYNEKWCPKDYGLNRRDVQLFLKKLRHHLGMFRYYLAGEYGPENQRPHYHAILFGIDFGNDRIPIGRNERGDTRYLSPVLERIWGMGRTEVGSVTPASAAYVAKYCTTKKNGNLAHEHYLRHKDGISWHVEPEFALMSLKPGIGATWYRRYKSDVFPSDETVVEGRQVKTPRYYDTLLEREDEEGLSRVKEARLLRATENAHDNTPERLRVKEEIMKLRAKTTRSAL